MRPNRTFMSLVFVAAAVLTPADGLAGWSGEMPVSKREELRDEVLRAFRHAYGSYMAHACEFCPGFLKVGYQYQRGGYAAVLEEVTVPQERRRTSHFQPLISCWVFNRTALGPLLTTAVCCVCYPGMPLCTYTSCRAHNSSVCSTLYRGRGGWRGGWSGDGSLSISRGP